MCSRTCVHLSNLKSKLSRRSITKNGDRVNAKPPRCMKVGFAVVRAMPKVHVSSSISRHTISFTPSFSIILSNIQEAPVRNLANQMTMNKKIITSLHAPTLPQSRPLRSPLKPLRTCVPCYGSHLLLALSYTRLLSFSENRALSSTRRSCTRLSLLNTQVVVRLQTLLNHCTSTSSSCPLIKIRAQSSHLARPRSPHSRHNALQDFV